MTQSCLCRRLHWLMADTTSYEISRFACHRTSNAVCGDGETRRGDLLTGHGHAHGRRRKPQQRGNELI